MKNPTLREGILNYARKFRAHEKAKKYANKKNAEMRTAHEDLKRMFGDSATSVVMPVDGVLSVIRFDHNGISIVPAKFINE